MGWLRAVLRMGPVMLILNTIVVVVPELARPAGLLSVIYQAYAFYGIFKFASEEFGGENLLARYDDSKHANEGTWQTAKPSKFWAQAPFCCVWSTLTPFAVLLCETLLILRATITSSICRPLFYPFMVARKFQVSDIAWLKVFVGQYMLFGPTAQSINLIMWAKAVSVAPVP